MEIEKDRRMQLESEGAEQPAKSESVGTKASCASRRSLLGATEELTSAYQRLLQEKQELNERLLRRQAESARL